MLAAALVAGGCATDVVGEATPPPVESTGPLAELLGQVDLFAATGRSGNVLVDTTGDGAGGVRALLHTPGEDRPHTLVSVPADGDGLGEPATVDVPQVVSVDSLHGTRDGRVLVVGQVDPEDSDRTMFGLLVVDAETGRGPAYRLLPEGEYRDSSYTALSPDQQTLYAVVLTHEDDEYDLHLIAADVDSGEIRATRNIDDVVTEQSVARGVVATGEGGVAVAVEIYENPTDDYGQPTIARFDADLEPQGEPVPLTTAEDQEFEALQATADGTVVAHIRDGYESLLVRLASGADEPEVAFDSEDYLTDLVVDPAGTWAHVLDEEGPFSVDLDSGEATDPVDLGCGPENNEVSFLLPAGDGGVLAQGYCQVGDSDEEPPEQVWKLGTAA